MAVLRGKVVSSVIRLQPLERNQVSIADSSFSGTPEPCQSGRTAIPRRWPSPGLASGAFGLPLFVSAICVLAMFVAEIFVLSKFGLETFVLHRPTTLAMNLQASMATMTCN